MHGWQNTTLGAVITSIDTGKSFRCEERPPIASEVGVVKVSAVTWGTYDEEESKTCLDAARIEPRYLIEEGDFLFSRANTIQLIGACVIAGAPSRRLMLSDKILRFRFTDEVEPKWVLHWLRSKHGRSEIERLSSGNQESMRNIGQERIRAIALPLPLPDDQRRIVAEIEKQFTRLEAGVSALRRVQANLKRYRAAVLKAACEGRLVPTEAELARAEGRPFESGQQLLARILTERRQNWQGRGSFVEPRAADASSLPELPIGWCWARVEQLSNVVRGASPRPAGDPRYFGGNVPWITVGPLTADNSPYLKEVSASLNELGREHSRYIDPHTLLLTNSGATLGVPKITLIGGCINDGVAALLDVSYPLKLYLLYFLRTQTEGLRGVNQGAAQPNLNTTIIKDINVPLPPLAEQTRIVAEVERRLSVVEELEAVVTTNLQRATRLRQSILQKAFAGEL
jgi:type I restriction enzyme, S subunit